MIYTTDRLIVRKIEMSDLTDIIEYGTDVETAKYMIYWPKSEKEIESFIQSKIAEMNKPSPNCFEFVLQDKSTRKVFGNISLNNHDDISEIGWISNKEYWNQGYMTEGLKELIKHIKTECQINKLYATCTKKNIGSYKVIEKIGMKLVEREKNIQGIKQGEKVIYTKLRYELKL